MLRDPYFALSGSDGGRPCVFQQHRGNMAENSTRRTRYTTVTLAVSNCGGARASLIPPLPLPAQHHSSPNIIFKFSPVCVSWSCANGELPQVAYTLFVSLRHSCRSAILLSIGSSLTLSCLKRSGFTRGRFTSWGPPCRGASSSPRAHHPPRWGGRLSWP